METSLCPKNTQQDTLSMHSERYLTLFASAINNTTQSNRGKQEHQIQKNAETRYITVYS